MSPTSKTDAPAGAGVVFEISKRIFRTIACKVSGKALICQEKKHCAERSGEKKIALHYLAKSKEMGNGRKRMKIKMEGFSMDIENANKEKLQMVFPECFVEGRLDIDKLLSLCGEYITDDYEKYEFKWKGKSDCLRLAQKRSTGTLRPCPEESVNFDITQNLYIEGDNLEVLKLLQKSYFRKVKMIYIDPHIIRGMILCMRMISLIHWQGIRK